MHYGADCTNIWYVKFSRRYSVPSHAAFALSSAQYRHIWLTGGIGSTPSWTSKYKRTQWSPVQTRNVTPSGSGVSPIFIGRKVSPYGIPRPPMPKTTYVQLCLVANPKRSRFHNHQGLSHGVFHSYPSLARTVSSTPSYTLWYHRPQYTWTWSISSWRMATYWCWSPPVKEWDTHLNP